MNQVEYLRREQAAAYLVERYGSFKTATLTKYASVGGGPKFRRIGRFPVYTVADLDEWASSRTSALVESTAEYTKH